jgi:hypothetical protein
MFRGSQPGFTRNLMYSHDDIIFALSGENLMNISAVRNMRLSEVDKLIIYKDKKDFLKWWEEKEL